jgi:RHS repeat-associated protein
LILETVHTSTTLTPYGVGCDGNGNVAALVTVNTLSASFGAIYEYDPYGQLLHSEGAESANNPFQFATKYRDHETGLVYYDHRFYDPSMGRFISRDPAEEAGGLNLYGFVANDPVNGWDMLGLDAGNRADGVAPDSSDEVVKLERFDVTAKRPDPEPVDIGVTLSMGGGGGINSIDYGEINNSLAQSAQQIEQSLRGQTYQDLVKINNHALIQAYAQHVIGLIRQGETQAAANTRFRGQVEAVLEKIFDDLNSLITNAHGPDRDRLQQYKDAIETALGAGIVTFNETNKNGNTDGNDANGNYHGEKLMSIDVFFNPTDRHHPGGDEPPYIALAHELTHVDDYYSLTKSEMKALIGTQSTVLVDHAPVAEERAIWIENQFRSLYSLPMLTRHDY